MTDYEIKTVVELKALCKEKGIMGYSHFVKPKLIELLKENHLKESSEYDKLSHSELTKLCRERKINGYKSREPSGKVIKTKEKMIKLLMENNVKKTLFQYLIDNNPLILSKFVGDQNDLKSVSYGTEKIFTWKCDNQVCLNTYKQSGNKIYRQDSTSKYCDKCLKENSAKKTLFQYLTDNYPVILSKFVGDQNDLKTVSHGTNKIFTWKCDNLECLNTYKQSPNNIYRKDFPRKYCDNCSKENRYINKNIAIMKRSGSIQDKFPSIEKIWSKDNIKTSNEFSPGSNERVKLKCPNNSANHPEYKIDVCKIQEHTCFRCPKCVTKSSNAEMRIYSELKYSFNDVRWQQKIEGREADITIEDIKLVIEIDGFPWHKDKSEKDLEKNIIFQKNGYNVLRIRDPRLDIIACNTIICNLTNLPLIDYNKIVEWINTRFNCNIVKYDDYKKTEYYKEIQASIMYVKYEESIEHIFPDSKKLWDFEKNAPFIPSQLTYGSHMEIWLKCCKGHSWKRNLSHLFRTIKGKKHYMKCPECTKPKSNKRIIQINGKLYSSISKCCKDLNIDRNILYKYKDIDMSITENIQKLIEEIIKKKIV